jgi:phospholipid N-methyltransferase
LAQALARDVGQGDRPLRILEVGPGTGAVTEWIARRMTPDDRLDLVELNEQFVARLEHRFAAEPAFRRVRDRALVRNCAIETLDAQRPYDLIVSGLPLNNFEVELVEQILDTLMGLLEPGGTLAFFEYIAIRSAKATVSGAGQRARLRGIGGALRRLFDAHETEHQAVLPNLPPAWVHRVRKSETSVAAAPVSYKPDAQARETR